MPKNKSDRRVKPRFDPSIEKPIFKWESPDKMVYKKNFWWYATLLFVTSLLAFILYRQQLYSGVALVLTAGFAFILLSRMKPRVVRCGIYSQGVVVDSKIYRYDDLKSFWITWVDVPKARLQQSGIVAGQVIMPLLNIDPEQVRLYLSKYLPEDEKQGEDLVDIVNRFLKF